MIRTRSLLSSTGLDYQHASNVYESKAAFSIGVTTRGLKLSFDLKGVVVAGITNDSHQFSNSGC